MSDDDNFDAELKLAKAMFEGVINHVLDATPLTDAQKAAALQQCLTRCYRVAAMMLAFAGHAGMPATETMTLALAVNFDAFINPGEATPPRRQRH